MPKTGASHYHAQLGLSDKSREINGLVVCNCWDVIVPTLLSNKDDNIHKSEALKLIRQKNINTCRVSKLNDHNINV